MANEYDYESGGGSGFMMGLLTGTVLGAGLGMLFAPKSGSELRGQLSESASHLGRSASEVAEKGRELGRDAMGKAREAVSRGADEARGMGSNVGTGSTGSTGSTSPGSPYSSGPSTRDRG